MRMKRNLKAIPVLVAGLFTSQLSIAAGSVSADPTPGTTCLPCRCQQMRISLR
jgi:hypothetical protein